MTPPKSSTTTNNKLLGLEIIRFVSAVAVLIWHYQHFAYVPNKPINFIREQQPFYSLFRLFYNYGFYGVQVFWCISGFIFFWKYKDAIAEKAVSGKNFFVLRFSRLYPLHIVTLVLVLALQTIYFNKNGFYFIYRDNDFKHFFYQIFLASNWGFERGNSYNGPIWSISIEVLIYFVFFLTSKFLGKSIVVSIGILLFCIFVEKAHVSSPIIDCIGYFYIGGLSATASQAFEKTRFRKILHVFSFCAIVLLPPIICFFKIYEYNCFIPLFLMAYIPTLLYFIAHNIDAPRKIQVIIEIAGNMTYSSYLSHFPLQLGIALFYSYTRQNIPFYSEIFFCFFMAITLLLSIFIYRYFELPLQMIIRSKFTPATYARSARLLAAKYHCSRRLSPESR